MSKKSEIVWGFSLSHIMRIEGVNKIFVDTLVFSGHPNDPRSVILKRCIIYINNLLMGDLHVYDHI